MYVTIKMADPKECMDCNRILKSHRANRCRSCASKIHGFKKGKTAWNKGKSWNEWMSQKGQEKIRIIQKKFGFQKGNIPLNLVVHNKGQTLEETYGPERAKIERDKLVKANIGKTLSKSHRYSLRKAAIKYMENVRNIRYPCLGKQETRILDTLEKDFNYAIIRQHKILGYFLDGYCPALNLVIEVDESYHSKNIIKDLERQKEIESFLNCAFVRIKTGD